jgi:hypothetical protein
MAVMEKILSKYSQFLKHTQGSMNKVPRAKFEWSEEKARDFNSVPIEMILNDPYFLAQGSDLYPAHKDDIIELFTRKKNGDDIRFFVDEEAFGSGKTFKSGAILFALIYYNITMWSYKEHYPTIAEDTRFSFLCGNKDYTLAKEVTFSEQLPFFLRSPFFIDYFPPEFTMEDVNAFKVKPSLVRFPSAIVDGKPLHGNIAIFTTASDALSDIGYQLKGVVFDEINYWDIVEDSKRMTGRGQGNKLYGNVYDAAAETIDIIEDRVSNRFEVGGKFDWATLFYFISAAAYKDDTTDRFRMRAEHDKRVMFRKRTEWDAKPEIFQGNRTRSGVTFDFDLDNMEVINAEAKMREYESLIGPVSKGREDFEKQLMQEIN